MSARLSELAGLLGEPVINATPGFTEIGDVEHDSRLVEPGVMFACIPGEATDGHAYAQAAVGDGAVALLVERRLDLGVPEIVVANVRKAVGAVASTVHGDPSSALAVVGVTGTNGKTTTVRIVASLIDALGGSAGEIGTLTGVRTTPEATDLQRDLALARRAGRQVMAMEVSSHALSQHRVDGTRFRVAAFTNLGIDHLDHHGDLESYYAAKARLFVPEFSDLAIVNTATPAGRRLADQIAVPLVEIDSDAVDIEHVGALDSRFVWRDLSVSLPLGGAFNITNAVMAAEIVVALGHEPADVAGALALVPSIPGRFESIDEGQPFSVIVDYAHTPDGLETVLDAARRVTRRNLVLVFGAGGDRDRAKRSQMGEVARRLADRVVVTNDNPRSEEPDRIIAGIVSGMEHPPELIEPDRRIAIRHAISGARAGDVVVVAGKGHEATQTIGNEVTEFDDRVVAREELRRLGRLTS